MDILTFRYFGLDSYLSSTWKIEELLISFGVHNAAEKYLVTCYIFFIVYLCFYGNKQSITKTGLGKNW